MTNWEKLCDAIKEKNAAVLAEGPNGEIEFVGLIFDNEGTMDFCPDEENSMKGKNLMYIQKGFLLPEFIAEKRSTDSSNKGS